MLVLWEGGREGIKQENVLKIAVKFAIEVKLLCECYSVSRDIGMIFFLCGNIVIFWAFTILLRIVPFKKLHYNS